MTRRIKQWISAITIQYQNRNNRKCGARKYESIHDVLCNFTPFCFTAKQQGNLLGVVSGYTAYSEVYIYEMLVFPEYRGHGIGKQLIEQVYEWYKNSGLDNIKRGWTYKIPYSMQSDRKSIL